MLYLKYLQNVLLKMSDFRDPLCFTKTGKQDQISLTLFIVSLKIKMEFGSILSGL